MSPDDYIKEREKTIAQESGLPKEGDLKDVKVNNEYIQMCFYQGHWVDTKTLPKDHPSYLPF